MVSAIFELLKSRGFHFYSQCSVNNIIGDALYGYGDFINDKIRSINDYFQSKNKKNSNMIFSGIPGTGKTQVIYHLIKNTCDVYLFINRINNVKDLDILQLQIDLLLKKNKKVALYFNEVDSFLNDKSDAQIISKMASFVDGWYYKNVIIFYDTNHRSKVSQKVIRSGRVEHDNSFGLPDNAERINLFKEIFKEKNTVKVEYVINSEFLRLNKLEQVVANVAANLKIVSTEKEKNRVIQVFAYFTAGQTHADIVKIANDFDSTIHEKKMFDIALISTFTKFFLHSDNDFIKKNLQEYDNELKTYFEGEFFSSDLIEAHAQEKSEELDTLLGIGKGGNKEKMRQENFSL
jgi:hypothetical protein